MGSNSLTPKQMSDFLRQYCGVLTRDWMTDESWKNDNAKLKYIIDYLRDLQPQELSGCMYCMGAPDECRYC